MAESHPHSHSHDHDHDHDHGEAGSGRALYGAEGCYHDPLDPRNQGYFSQQEAHELVRAARKRSQLPKDEN